MRREVLIALLMLGVTLGLGQYLATADVTVNRAEFADFPRHIANRSSQDQPLSAPILKTLGVTDYLSRSYRNDSAGVPVDLYIGFYASQRTGATYHSPKNCLPGGGWQMEDVAETTLQRGSATVQVNEIIIRRGIDRQLVLYWYQDRGRVIASEYMAKLYMVWDAALRHRTDGALVRVIVPVEDDEAAARQTARDFATELLPRLNRYLPD